MADGSTLPRAFRFLATRDPDGRSTKHIGTLEHTGGSGGGMAFTKGRTSHIPSFVLLRLPPSNGCEDPRATASPPLATNHGFAC